MAIWTLSNQHKKNAVEISLWYRDGVCFRQVHGYRWGTWTCESDEQPDIDLKNEDGYEIGQDDHEWEMQSMDDGCWMDWEYPDSMSEEDRTQVEEAWENDWYDGLEALGWSNDDTEYWIHGPLQLEDESGKIVQGEAE